MKLTEDALISAMRERVSEDIDFLVADWNARVDHIVDDWYDRAPLFPGEVGEEFTFPMPSPYERKGKA